MMSRPLTIGSLIDHAARYHGETEIVSVETTGGQRVSNWAETDRESRLLASALGKLGLEAGDRVATIAWNNQRHLEIYFGASGAGYVCHTINPRLTPEQLIYIINHAEDQVLCLDRTFLPAAVKLRPHLKTVKHLVLMGPRDEEAAAMAEDLIFFDELLETGDPDFAWPDLDENSASSLCYTSGTTGHPKGVLYSHRSTVLHTLGANQPDGLGLSASDCVMPVVPMFHVNAWGVPYIAAAVGAKMVLPGPGLDGASLVSLIDEHKVTMALGVPTIWTGLLAALDAGDSKVESLKQTLVGGSALPPSMFRAFQDRYDVELVHGWGMTETSPIGTINRPLEKHTALSQDEQTKLRYPQGRPPFGVELRILDEQGNTVANDGESVGRLFIRGHWIVDSYFGADDVATEDGWFDTGDIASIDPDGYLTIRDRAKDIIKSGGEWISTVELENIAVSHPEIANAAVIAAHHPKWDERPVVIAVAAPDASPDEAEILAHYEGKVAHWQIPDKVIFVDTLPLGGTGKVLKSVLRDEFGDSLHAE